MVYLTKFSSILTTTAFFFIYFLTPTFSFNTTTLPPQNQVVQFQSYLQNIQPDIEKTLEMAKYFSRQIDNPKDRAAIFACAKLMDISKDRVIDSISALEDYDSTISHDNAHTWLSSVFTNHVLCLDGLVEGSSRKISSLENKINELISSARVSLAMIVVMKPPKVDKVMEPLNGDYPMWLMTKDQKLLEASPNKITPNVVVSMDGTGKYKTVNEAIVSAPKNSQNRYVIYVKKGLYKENVEIGKDLKNIMLIGDGQRSTIITGDLSVGGGLNSTVLTATVGVDGDGFIAQDIGFQNTAGADKEQAVALRVGGDQSVINRCFIDGFQDTLFTQANRQFYRDSYITGTVDFIFGDAPVVFQKCTLAARKPMYGQTNMVIAQGRKEKNQNSAISIQQCDIIASADLEPVKATFSTYLGRPWKPFSTTVVMQSNIGDHINPAGWFGWEGHPEFENTLYYGEYANKGPGADTSKRVKWPGYHVITDPAKAQPFTVAQLIQGGTWLSDIGVNFTVGL